MANHKTCFHYKYTNCQQGGGGGTPRCSFISSYQTIINAYQEDPNNQEWPNCLRIFLTDWKTQSSKYLFKWFPTNPDLQVPFRSQIYSLCLPLGWVLEANIDMENKILTLHGQTNFICVCSHKCTCVCVVC